MEDEINFLDSNWNNTDQDFVNYKKKVLKLLGILGIDTRYISYTPNTIYINNVRFSKFSKKREDTFQKYFPEIAIVRSTVFQKICARASKILANKLNPKDNILLLKSQNSIDDLLEIVLEPYLRKYGITIYKSDFLSLDEAINKLNDDKSKYKKMNINAIASSLTLNNEVESILSSIFSGNGIGNDKLENYLLNNNKNENYIKKNYIKENNKKEFNKKEFNKNENNENEFNKIKIIYPFLNVSNEWINLFYDNLSNNYKNNINYNYNPINDFDNLLINENNDKKIKNNNYNLNNKNNSNQIANSFMEFLDELIPQYKENILKSAFFIEKNSDK